MIHRRNILAAAVLAGAGLASSARAVDRRWKGRELTGTWTNASYTRLERPSALTSLVVSPSEAEAFEAPRRALNGALVTPEDLVGQATSEFPENGPGLARIGGEIRSSWIVDPADGRIPWTDEARRRLKLGERPVENFDNVEARPTEERCLTAAGAGAPILNGYGTNLIQIVQTPDSVVIVSEKNHDARIVRLAGALRPLRAGLSGWLGASSGRWEGATLRVETVGLRPGLTKIASGLWLSDRARVVERFTRKSFDEIHYVFDVEDTSLFKAPFRGEMPFHRTDGQVFEFACHEGNYSLRSILSAARQGNQDQSRWSQAKFRASCDAGCARPWGATQSAANRLSAASIRTRVRPLGLSHQTALVIATASEPDGCRGPGTWSGSAWRERPLGLRLRAHAGNARRPRRRSVVVRR